MVIRRITACALAAAALAGGVGLVAAPNAAAKPKSCTLLWNSQNGAQDQWLFYRETMGPALIKEPSLRRPCTKTRSTRPSLPAASGTGSLNAVQCRLPVTFVWFNDDPDDVGVPRTWEPYCTPGRGACVKSAGAPRKTPAPAANTSSKHPPPPKGEA